MGTLRPIAKRVRIFCIMAWQYLWNWSSSASSFMRADGRGCWALPLMNSPKFIALTYHEKRP